jgi:hypothetical protein
MFGGTLGTACVGLNWITVAQAADQAALAVTAGARAPPLTFLSAREAADVDAIAAQIIPTDATPGAREAGVLFFIDGGLASFFAHHAVAFRAGLGQFQSACRQHYPQVDGFAALAPEQQIEFLRTVEATDFFQSMRLLTVLGMFTAPAHGGNRDNVGWKLLGFEDEHVFSPPFGYYDRDYPGFATDPEKS